MLGFVDERQGDEYIMDVACSPTTAMELDRNNLRHYTDAEIRQLYKKINNTRNTDKKATDKTTEQHSFGTEITKILE
jgi:uncharacterized protein YacL (UPF0231 family)